MARILLVEDSRIQAREQRHWLEAAGYEVETAGNGVRALEAMRQQLPAIVVTDLQMPEMNGLELVEAVRKEFPQVPVVLMTAHGSEEIAAEALVKGAACYVPKLVLTKHLVPTVENLLTVVEAEHQAEQVQDCLIESTARYELANEDKLVPPLVRQFQIGLRGLRLCDATEVTRVGVALRESLLNAMHHGNLEVSSELRQEDERVFHGKLAERRSELPYRDRRVRVVARLSRAEAVFQVSDEGPGFDVAALPDPNDPTNLERVGGRGILLIRTFMDRVEFNDRGNCLTMVKRRTLKS